MFLYFYLDFVFGSLGFIFQLWDCLCIFNISHKRSWRTFYSQKCIIIETLFMLIRTLFWFSHFMASTLFPKQVEKVKLYNDLYCLDVSVISMEFSISRLFWRTATESFWKHLLFDNNLNRKDVQTDVIWFGDQFYQCTLQPTYQ